MENISIFFDTNIIESQFSCDKQNFLFHGKITPSRVFHDVIRYIKDADLSRITTLYIHSISWKEFNLHLADNYDSRIGDMKRYVDAYSKSFSPIVDIEYEIKNKTQADYVQHIKQLGQIFLEEYNCKIIDYPKDITLFETLVEKCVNKEPPFVIAKAGGKDYNDAGLKDALILETILKHKLETGNLCLFVSNDKDFSNVNELYICKTLDDIKIGISKYFEINDFTTIRNRITTNDYLKEQIIANTGNAYDPKTVEFEIREISYNKDDKSVFQLDVACIINETKYFIKCTYDSVSNEFIDITYTKEDE